jgi:hypothetical protein
VTEQTRLAWQVRDAYQAVLDYVSTVPGFLSGWVVAGHSAGEIGRLTIWVDEAAANQAATDQHALVLHARVLYAAAGNVWDRSFETVAPGETVEASAGARQAPGGALCQGMVVQVPLQLWSLPGKVTAAALHEALCARYAGRRFVRVMPLEQRPAMLAPEALNGTNLMEFCVFDNGAEEQALLVARADNLGKGASGTAAQDLDLMLGLGEHSYDLPEGGTI